MVERIVFSLDRLNLPAVKDEGEERKVKEEQKVEGGSFLDLLKEGIKKVNELEKDADKMAQKLATGELEDIHELTIAVRKAELAVRLLTEIRNRIVDAYDRLTRLT
ncbi:MAG: flagellar hook-basal body complex protein FliE [Synergistetes bacterium]|nr:MAG: Flagellar hook-basal body complex protein FliE [bacterium 42_11]MBC7331023.1 flagellar hook-basal body complex protein FliE [Synergistota bacterium]MDK2871586.1 flagellar hook-basal body complex protein FliE [bacterium]